MRRIRKDGEDEVATRAGKRCPVEAPTPARSLSARPVAVDGVSQEYSGADDSEERGDCIQHGDDPNAQRLHLTARVATQSKGFRRQPIFGGVMMIFCNTSGFERVPGTQTSATRPDQMRGMLDFLANAKGLEPSIP
jgi:hypothetical protein